MLFTALNAPRPIRQLATEHQRLQVEKRAQATVAGKKIARLHMRTATTWLPTYVRDHAPQPAPHQTCHERSVHLSPCWLEKRGLLAIG